MNNAQTYTHPLSGDMSRGVVPASRPSSLTIAAWVLVVLLACLLIGGGCVAYRWKKAATAAVEAVSNRVEYEPLSKVGDGSYADEPPSGRAKSLGILKRLRSR
jgi:hypothetical protein